MRPAKLRLIPSSSGLSIVIHSGNFKQLHGTSTGTEVRVAFEFVCSIGRKLSLTDTPPIEDPENMVPLCPEISGGNSFPSNFTIGPKCEAIKTSFSSLV